MGTLTPGAKYIYESPDGGETVYAREFGTTEKKLIGRSFKAEQMEKDLRDEIIWREMNRAASSNEALRKAIDHAILIYHMSKDNG